MRSHHIVLAVGLLALATLSPCFLAGQQRSPAREVGIADAQRSSPKLELPSTILTFGSLELSKDTLLVTSSKIVTKQVEQTYTVKKPVVEELADGHDTAKG